MFCDAGDVMRHRSGRWCRSSSAARNPADIGDAVLRALNESGERLGSGSGA